MCLLFINLFKSQVQCNVFEGATGEVALTAAGGLRQLPGLNETFETAALVPPYNNFCTLLFPNISCS